MESSVIKSLNLTYNPTSFIVGSEFGNNNNIYIKEKSDKIFEIDETQNLEQKLKDLELQIERKKKELSELEESEMLKIEQQKINLLREAEEESKNIIENAKLKIEVMKKDGFKIGSDEGYKKALEEFKEQSNNSFTIINTIIDDLKNKKVNLLNELKPELIEIVKISVASLISKEIEDNNEEILINNLTELFEEISEIKSLIIKVHPSNVKKIRNLKNVLVENLPLLEKLRIVPVESLDEVGCILDTDKGNFDNSLKSKFFELNESLKLIINSI